MVFVLTMIGFSAVVLFVSTRCGYWHDQRCGTCKKCQQEGVKVYILPDGYEKPEILEAHKEIDQYLQESR